MAGLLSVTAPVSAACWIRRPGESLRFGNTQAKLLKILNVALPMMWTACGQRAVVADHRESGMSGTHGDLFSEIGKIVLAAHAGQAIDLDTKSRELAQRYWKLGLPADAIARAITRSLGAVSVSMAIIRPARAEAAAEAPRLPAADIPSERSHGDQAAATVKSPAALFPSGVRLALLS
jgi:hypothetical protein